MLTPPIKLWKVVLGGLVLLGAGWIVGYYKGSESWHSGSLFTVDQLEGDLRICLETYAFPSRTDGPRAQHYEEALACFKKELERQRLIVLQLKAGN